MPKISDALPVRGAIVKLMAAALRGELLLYLTTQAARPSWPRSWSAPAPLHTRATRRGHEKHRERSRRDCRQGNA
jgi:hypothetical protein